MFRRTIAKLIVVFFFLLCAGCATERTSTVKRARALENLGQVLISQGKLRAGLEKLLGAVRLDPQNADLHHELAMVYKDLGEYEFSLDHFNRALEIRPEFPTARYNMGTVYLLLGKWDLAIKCFEKVVKIITYETPEFAYNGIGWAYYKKGEYQKAIAGYRQALRQRPSYSFCHNNLGLAYEAINGWDAAIDAFKRAISFDREYAMAHFNLGRLYLKLNRKKEAADELRETIKIDPTGPLSGEARKLLRTIKL